MYNPEGARILGKTSPGETVDFKYGQMADDLGMTRIVCAMD